MPASFSIQELQLIRGSLSRRTNEEIAEILERSVEDVIEAINDITGGQATERQLAIDEQRRSQIKPARTRSPRPSVPKPVNPRIEEEKRRKLERKQLAERAAEKEREKRKLAAQREADRQKRLKQIADKAFKTKIRDWSKYRSVRADKNTMIMVPIGEDPKEAVRRYKANVAENVMRQKIKDSNF